MKAGRRDAPPAHNTDRTENRPGAARHCAAHGVRAVCPVFPVAPLHPIPADQAVLGV